MERDRFDYRQGCTVRRSLVRLLLTFGLLASVALSCTGGSTETQEKSTPHFVTTIPPLAMVIRPVVEGRGTVEALLKSGDSPHTYAPVPSDARAAANASTLFYGAEHLDGWAAGLSSQRRLRLVDLLPDSSTLTFEAEGHAQQTVDPHFWTDPEAVRSLLPALADTLCTLDSRGCSVYRANADSFATTLRALDVELEAMMEPVRNEPVVLGQPFFRYFLARYGPRLVAVVHPGSANEPSLRQIQSMVSKIETTGARALLVHRQQSNQPARAIAEATAILLVSLDPMGGEGEMTYEDLLRSNARTLIDVLHRETD